MDFLILIENGCENLTATVAPSVDALGLPSALPCRSCRYAPRYMGYGPCGTSPYVAALLGPYFLRLNDGILSLVANKRRIM
jgi:hypothetical protein